MNDELKFSSV